MTSPPQDRPSDKLTELREGLSSGVDYLLDDATSIAATRARLYLDCVSPADQVRRQGIVTGDSGIRSLNYHSPRLV